MAVYLPIKEDLEEILENSNTVNKWDLQDLLQLVNVEIIALQFAGKSSKPQQVVKTALSKLIQDFERYDTEYALHQINFAYKTYSVAK